MQFIEDACLINLVVSSIFTSRFQMNYSFDWSHIKEHGLCFSHKYKHEDAGVLLQLSLMVTNTNFDSIPLNTPDWLEDTAINYARCPSPIISQGISNSVLNHPSNLAHILYNKTSNTLIIIFTGTSNICLATSDLSYTQVELEDITNYTPGMKGHKGTYLGYEDIRSRLLSIIERYIPRNPQIIITGHSLGGALSGLCAIDLAYYNPIHYSFAAPLFLNVMGSEIFGQLVKHSYRVANISDLVTMMPLPITPNGDVFCHVGESHLFQKNLGQYTYNHSLSYIQEYNIEQN